MARRSNTKGKGSSKLVKSARRNVRIQTAPQRNAVDRAELDSGQDYLRALQAARSAYGGFQKELGQTPDFPLNRLTNQLQGQLSTFHDMLGGSPSPVPQGIPTTTGGENPVGLPTGLPGSEQGAGTALYSQLGDNAFNTLTNTASRDEMYSRSAGREGALAERYAKENLIQDLQDQLQGFEQRRMEIADLQGPMVQQEMERLQQERQDEASNRALMQYLMGSIRGDINGGGPRGGGGGGGGNRPGGGGGGQGTMPTGGMGGYAGATDSGGNGQWSVNRAVRNINQADTFQDLPDWLESLLYRTEAGPERWDELQAMNDPRRTQIFRRTRPTWQRLLSDYAVMEPSPPPSPGLEGTPWEDIPWAGGSFWGGY